MLTSLGLIALGAFLVFFCWPPVEWTDYIGFWWGLSCVLGGGYGLVRNHVKSRAAKRAVAEMDPEQSLFRALAVGCPTCQQKAGFYQGPEAPGAQNIYCANAKCRQGYNVMAVIGRAQKLDREPPFKYPEDFRDTKLNGEPKDKPKPAQRVVLSREQITRTNAHRRVTGRPRLSAEGLRAAIVSAPPPSGSGTNDWLLYLLVWQAVDSAHISQHDDIGTGVIIDHVTEGGGRYGGAGATATWTDNTNTDAKSAWDTAQAATAAAVLAAASASAEAESSTSSLSSSSSQESQSSSSNDGASSAPAPDSAPAPTPSADPSPSPSYSTPSSDSYSSSSSSYDSSSSSSSFDSGGGGSFDGGGGGSF